MPESGQNLFVLVECRGRPSAASATPQFPVADAQHAQRTIAVASDRGQALRATM
jgi:hypothetical protein